MLISFEKILKMAEEGGYCAPAFNVYNIETARGALNAAMARRSPVILQFYSRLVTSGVAEDVAPAVRDMAQRADVPVCFHLDHGAGEKEVVRSLRLGMTGIMFDASTRPLEENIRETRRVVELCSFAGVGVEGELGHVGKAADGDETTAEYTHPDEAARYVKETGVAALAVMVGTAHGRYKKAPVLDIGRIREIKNRTGVALVLHGGSGVPDDQIRAAISAGIRKMNFSTDLCYAFLDGCRERAPGIIGIDLFMTEPIERVRAFCASKICVLGAENRV